MVVGCSAIPRINTSQRIRVMNRSVLVKSVAAATAAVGALGAGVWRAEAADYVQTNLCRLALNCKNGAV